MRTATLTATALTLALAAPAWAQRYDDRYPDRHPSHRDMARVQRLAQEVEQTAYWIHHQAERNNRRPDYREARVLAQLHELDDRARSFHREVREYRHDPRNSRRDFRALVRTHRETWESLETISRRPYIDRGMARIDDLLDELSGYYGRDRYDRYDRDGRYDRRDRDHRDGRYDDRYDRDGRRPR